MHGAIHWEGQGQEVEGVEAGTNVSAGLALDLRLELAVEQVHHDRAVPSQVVLPGLPKKESHADQSKTSLPIQVILPHLPGAK